MARRWALALLLVGLHTTRPARGTGAWLETSDLSSMVCDEGDGRLMHPEHALTFIRHRGNTELGTCVIGRPCVFERNIGGLVPGVQYVVVASVTSSRHDWREISISERAIRSIPTNDSQAPVEAQEHQEHQEHRYRGTVFVGDMAAGDHYVVQMSVYDGCAYLRGSGSMRESALLSFSKNLGLQVIEVDMDFSPLDFDATENSVTYPWRFFVHIWSLLTSIPLFISRLHADSWSDLLSAETRIADKTVAPPAPSQWMRALLSTFHQRGAKMITR